MQYCCCLAKKNNRASSGKMSATYFRSRSSGWILDDEGIKYTWDGVGSINLSSCTWKGCMWHNSMWASCAWENCMWQHVTRVVYERVLRVKPCERKSCVRESSVLDDGMKYTWDGGGSINLSSCTWKSCMWHNSMWASCAWENCVCDKMGSNLYMKKICVWNFVKELCTSKLCLMWQNLCTSIQLDNILASSRVLSMWQCETQSEGPCYEVPHLPHRMKVHVTKSHACHTEWRSMSRSPTPAT